ncbi:MAG: LPS export ABC transporter ATP-binding protein [Proteobacteria bacterium]|nr:LPS export ABC transporter ATP-binding protein [Pseudomonadota bacterium]
MTEPVITTIKTPRTGLRVKNLQKSFRRRVVLQDVSMELQRGEVVALLGPNGAGKTTCFYAVAGLQQPDKGEVTIDGQDVTQWPVYRRARLGLGYLPQESSIFRGLSVEENIRAVLEVTEKSEAVIHERLQQLLDEFGLTRLRGAPALALSGGERRRVEIARAMAASPAYMMLDEPFAGVDPIAIADIRRLVHGLKERGIGVLITDHNVRETLSLVDRAYIIYEGRVIMQGTPQEIVANDEVRRVYLGEEFSLG